MQAGKDVKPEEKREYEDIRTKAEEFSHQELHELFQRFKVRQGDIAGQPVDVMADASAAAT